MSIDRLVGVMNTKRRPLSRPPGSNVASGRSGTGFLGNRSSDMAQSNKTYAQRFLPIADSFGPR